MVLGEEDLLTLSLGTQDIQAGVSYGIISRAWTYDRMGAQARGDFGKAIFRIAHGKAVQHALERYLEEQGVQFDRDTTDYRSRDYWDMASPKGITIDVKEFNVFTDFRVSGRPPVSPSRIVSSSMGESWESFFPQLVPQDQFDRARKSCYVFALLAAPSSKRCPNTIDHPQGLIALPYSSDVRINTRYRLVHRAEYANARVKGTRMFRLEMSRLASVPAVPFNLTVGYGDHNGAAQREQFTLRPNESHSISGLSQFHYLRWHGPCPSTLGFAASPILHVVFRGVDSESDIVWDVSSSSFEDVWVYPEALWFIGWITADEFNSRRQQYPTYQPAADGRANVCNMTAGGHMAKGSFCYYYPPGTNGGTHNENYYVLPKDLSPMATLAQYLK